MRRGRECDRGKQIGEGLGRTPVSISPWSLTSIRDQPARLSDPSATVLALIGTRLPIFPSIGQMVKHILPCYIAL